MRMDEQATEFAGKAVADWDEDTGIADPEKVNYRITLDWDATEEGAVWTDKLAAFLDDPNAEQVTGLVVGHWGRVAEGENAATVVEALTAARERLPNLTALFLGDMTFEESEISWIMQSDVSPLFSAYPRLEHFRVRSGNGLSFGGLQHDHLKSLIVETGGLPATALREVMSARLPALEHLELWLGSSGYGWDGTIDDLAPILQTDLFPNLRYLGLRDSEITDEIAIAIGNAPILSHVRVLDLSLGTLSDEGAAALLASPAIRKLAKLDIHHHFLSEEMVARLTGVPAPDASTPSAELGIEVDASERQTEESYGGEQVRYVAVGE